MNENKETNPEALEAPNTRILRAIDGPQDLPALENVSDKVAMAILEGLKSFMKSKGITSDSEDKLNYNECASLIVYMAISKISEMVSGQVVDLEPFEVKIAIMDALSDYLQCEAREAFVDSFEEIVKDTRDSSDTRGN